MKRTDEKKRKRHGCVSVILTVTTLRVDRLGYLRWRGSRAPEETGDTAPTTTITPLKAERGEQWNTDNQ